MILAGHDQIANSGNAGSAGSVERDNVRALARQVRHICRTWRDISRVAWFRPFDQTDYGHSSCGPHCPHILKTLDTKPGRPTVQGSPSKCGDKMRCIQRAARHRLARDDQSSAEIIQQTRDW
jgi:hypothetical protein